jgi:ASC-1-like (ASCH) protein
MEFCDRTSGMSRRIVKKILPKYFNLIESGKKKYEFRVADFEVEEGDILVLEEWTSFDHSTRKPTGRVIEKKVSYSEKFSIDEFKQFEDIKKSGFYILQLE